MIYILLAIIFSVLAVFTLNNFSRLIDSLFFGLSKLNDKIVKKWGSA